MATGGSDETFEFICTPCSKESKQIEAVVYCIDCKECFCQTCFNFHSKFAATVVHKVLDKSGMKASGTLHVTQMPTQTCENHAGKLIVVYCGDHDELCCVECVTSTHMKCPTTTYVPDAAKGCRGGDEEKDVSGAITKLHDDLKCLKAVRENELQLNEKDNSETLNEITNFRDSLIDRINELAMLTQDQVNARHKERNNAIYRDIEVTEKMIDDTSNVIKNISSSDVNESQLFVNVKFGQKSAAKISTAYLKLKNNSETNHTDIDETFRKRNEIHQLLSCLNDLGRFVDINEALNLKSIGDFNVKVSQDDSVCNVIACCLLLNGTLVLTDWNNKRLKHLDASYNVTDHIVEPSYPWGVTCTGLEEVAITLTYLKKVQFVSVADTMSITRSFSTGDCCRGICCSKEELFVSCGGMTEKGLEEGTGHVEVYSLTGIILRCIQTDQAGQHIFSVPYHITTSTETTKIHVADEKNGVITLDRNGDSFSSFSDPGLAYARCLCAIDKNHILVCGRKSNNVFQINRTGKKVTELLRKADSIKGPKSLCFDRINSRLVVTLAKSDYIKVYELY